MPIFAFEGKRPAIARSAYVSPTAVIIGDVTIGERCYVGHGAILRGDYGSIEIGDETAVEEGVIIHARPDNRARIERRVTLGHGAMVHNATIREGAVVGMRAVISDDAEVGAGAIVGEMGLVKRGQVVPARKVAVGVPVNVIGDVGDRHANMTHRAKEIYIELVERYADGGLVELEPHSRVGSAIAPMVAIGTIHTAFESVSDVPRQGAQSGDAQGEIVIDPAFEEGLADLDGFSHLMVFFVFDRGGESRLRVKPHLDDAKRGVFATRSPRRPNPIGMTVVGLLEVDGRRLRVSGVDMLDGTPVLDIKPYVPRFDQQEQVRCGWLEPHLGSHHRDGEE